jgi:hypothetical protein
MTNWVVIGIGVITSILLLVIIWYIYNDHCIVLKRYALPYGTVEIVDSSCQEGLPHTWSQSIIRMTETDWNSSRRDNILRHERVHLRQRLEPEEWRSFYRSQWGYECTKQPPPGIPPHWLERLRPNPDTADGPWAVWKGRYAFFPTYRDAKRSLRSTNVQVWDVLKKQIVDIPGSWKQHFCDGGNCPHQFEHPHEIAAEYITNNFNSPAAQQLAESLLVKQ